jgi:hypothetical protein
MSGVSFPAEAEVDAWVDNGVEFESDVVVMMAKRAIEPRASGQPTC